MFLSKTSVKILNYVELAEADAAQKGESFTDIIIGETNLVFDSDLKFDIQ